MKVCNTTPHPIFISRWDVIAYAIETETKELKIEHTLNHLDIEQSIKECKAIYKERENKEEGKPKQEGPSEIGQRLGDKEKEDRIMKLEMPQTCMNREEQDQFKRMLIRNKDTLAFSMEEIGHCTWQPMRIRVDGSKGPCQARQFRYSPQKMDIIDTQIRQLLRLGIIEPSNSAWRSPLVVVQKKDGKPRLCTDYRVLNMMTEDDTYPTPTARSLFLYMAYRKPIIFTCIDLLSGYHQCDLHPDSRKYSAFASPLGVYQWKRVPFGMRQSSWQFTKIMSLALAGLMPRTCLAYLDDVIIFDPDVPSHIENVERVLKALHGAGLTVKPSKCEWGKREINFLGHTINAEGLGTQPRIIKKVQEFGRPHNKETLQSFQGLCNYYNKFVGNYATLAVPLNKLLRKGAPFVWSEECEQAFKTIQKKLTSPPLLVHPEIGGHFHILTDASDMACGSAVCHLKEGVMRPVIYYGYTFTKSETNYTITEKEGLAVIKTLKHFENMLGGAKITIITDHQPLIPLLQQAAKAPSKRLIRWSLALTDFNYEIKYEPGKTHYLPDFISRVPLSDQEIGVEGEGTEFEPEVGCELLATERESEENDEYSTERDSPEEQTNQQPKGQRETNRYDRRLKDIIEGIPRRKARVKRGEPEDITLGKEEITQREIRIQQEKDPECRPIMDYLMKGVLPETEREAATVLAKEGFMGIKEGILYKFSDPRKKKTQKSMELKARTVVPRSMVDRVLYLMHDDILCGGHIGTTALNNKLVESFYWKNMYMDIVDYVRKCERCALRKRAPHFKAKARSWDRPDYPWQVVQTDFIGPIRRSKEGYRYIMTFIDLLTGWPEAFCTKDCTATTAASVFLQQMACRYGRIEVMCSDRGSTYLGKMFREITARLTCKQRFTSSRNPTGNARAERLHKTLEDVIACYVTEDHEQWPDLLGIALWNVRSNISLRSGLSPYALMFGRDPTPMGYPEEREEPQVGSEAEWFLRTKHCIEMYQQIATEHVNIYETKLRDRLDKGARPVSFKEGEYCWYYDPMCAENNISKFAGKYRGPYRIQEVRGDNRVQLKSIKTGKLIGHLTNVNKLKRAYLETMTEGEGEQIEPRKYKENTGNPGSRRNDSLEAEILGSESETDLTQTNIGEPKPAVIHQEKKKEEIEQRKLEDAEDSSYDTEDSEGGYPEEKLRPPERVQGPDKIGQATPAQKKPAMDEDTWQKAIRIARKLTEKGKKQEKTMAKWSKRQRASSEGEEIEEKGRERTAEKRKMRTRNIDISRQLIQEKEELEKQRQEGKKDRENRAVERRKRRDRIEQRAAQARSEEEISDEIVIPKGKIKRQPRLGREQLSSSSE